MKIFILIFIALSSFPTFAGLNLFKNNTFKCRKNNYRFEELYKNVKKGVVVVRTPSGLGSGFVVKHGKDSTFILTNSHVVENYKRVAVIWDDKEIDGALVLFNGINQNERVKAKAFAYEEDFTKDLALLAIKRQKGISLEFYKDEPPVGRDVLSIGSPSGLDYTITRGIISGIRSEGEIIQTDAAINEGNSGGPLIGLNGCVVGINTFKLTKKEGLNFALSKKSFDNFLNKLPSDQKIESALGKENLSINNFVENYGGELIEKKFDDGLFADEIGYYLDNLFKFGFNRTNKHNFGYLKQFKKYYQQLIQDYDFAIFLDPSNFESYLARGKIKAALSGYYNVYSYVYEDRPIRSLEFENEYGWIKGFWNESLNDLNKAQNLNSNSLAPYFYKYKYIYSFDEKNGYRIYKQLEDKKNYYLSKVKTYLC